MDEETIVSMGNKSEKESRGDKMMVFHEIKQSQRGIKQDMF